MHDHDHAQRRFSGTGRLLTGMAWVVLLLGLWLWGREVTEMRHGIAAPATGDMAAAGRPPDIKLPPEHRPLRDALPQRIDIPGLGVQAPVVARGLDARGAPDPPPYDQPGVVGWYAGGARGAPDPPPYDQPGVVGWYAGGVAPGAPGTALMVGHVDTETRPAVFYRVSAMRPGQTIRVVRADAKVAEFTVESVQVLTRDHFDAHQAYGPHESGRAELRLVTCGGSFDRATRSYTANVVVSAYLTGAAGGGAVRDTDEEKRPGQAQESRSRPMPVPGAGSFAGTG